MARVPKEIPGQLRSKKPNQRTIWIAGDSELADDLEAARAKLQQLEIRLTAQSQESQLRPELTRAVQEAADKVARLEKEVREGSTKFVFRSLGRNSYSALIDHHPPTDAQVKEAETNNENKPTFNPDTFPQELVARCMIEPLHGGPFPEELNPELVDYVSWIFDSEEWNEPEVMELFFACVSVNNSRKALDLGKD